MEGQAVTTQASSNLTSVELRKQDTVTHNEMQHDAHNHDYKVFLPK